MSHRLLACKENNTARLSPQPRSVFALFVICRRALLSARKSLKLVLSQWYVFAFIISNADMHNSLTPLFNYQVETLLKMANLCKDQINGPIDLPLLAGWCVMCYTGYCFRKCYYLLINIPYSNLPWWSHLSVWTHSCLHPSCDIYQISQPCTALPSCGIHGKSGGIRRMLNQFPNWPFNTKFTLHQPVNMIQTIFFFLFLEN